MFFLLTIQVWFCRRNLNHRAVKLKVSGLQSASSSNQEGNISIFSLFFLNLSMWVKSGYFTVWWVRVCSGGMQFWSIRCHVWLVGWFSNIISKGWRVQELFGVVILKDCMNIWKQGPNQDIMFFKKSFDYKKLTYIIIGLVDENMCEV